MSENRRVKTGIVCLILISRVMLVAIFGLLVSGVWVQGASLAHEAGLDVNCIGTILLGNSQDSTENAMKLSSSKCGIEAGLAILRVSGNCCWWVLNADQDDGKHTDMASAVMVPCWYNLTSAKAVEQELCHFSDVAGPVTSQLGNGPVTSQLANDTKNEFIEQNRQRQRENLVLRSTAHRHNSDGSIGGGDSSSHFGGGESTSHFHSTQLPDGLLVHTHHSHDDITTHYDNDEGKIHNYDNIGAHNHNNGESNDGIQLKHLGTLGTLSPSHQEFHNGETNPSLASGTTTPPNFVYPTLAFKPPPPADITPNPRNPRGGQSPNPRYPAYQLVKNTAYSTPSPFRNTPLSNLNVPANYNALQGRNAAVQMSSPALSAIVFAAITVFFFEI